MSLDRGLDCYEGGTIRRASPRLPHPGADPRGVSAEHEEENKNENEEQEEEGRGGKFLFLPSSLPPSFSAFLPTIHSLPRLLRHLRQQGKCV
ncbi:hypothetical protein E2C01_065051 [Portunus trituberculatus]|uniref:Uncharacterized protein n=1 Tax=Portunus trituberculatus TaxID=210409 RepID=A0A5B7HHU4_PORTR|nr:hypothetical protein [Portunus trituberculatus]